MGLDERRLQLGHLLVRGISFDTILGHVSVHRDDLVLVEARGVGGGGVGVTAHGVLVLVLRGGAGERGGERGERGGERREREALLNIDKGGDMRNKMDNKVNIELSTV